MILQRVQQGIEATSITKSVHKRYKLAGNALVDARHSIDAAMAWFGLHEVIEILINVINIVNNALVVNTREVRLNSRTKNRDILIVLV